MKVEKAIVEHAIKAMRRRVKTCFMLLYCIVVVLVVGIMIAMSLNENENKKNACL